MLASLLAIAVAAPFESPTVVDDVRVSGLWFSREATVLRELPFQPGDEATPEQWDLFVTRLWNLGIFSRVDVALLEEDGRHIAVVTIEDRFPIGPIIRANFGGGQFFLWLGGADINLFGRALEVRGLYERFGSQNGFHLAILDPRFLDRRVAASLQGEWLSRPQPEYIVRRAALRASVDFNVPGTVTDDLRLGVRVEGNSDELFAVSASGAAPPPSSVALVAGGYLRAGRVDTDRLRFGGGFVEVHADLVGSNDSTWPFAGLLTAESQYYWKLGSRLNVATRVLAGFARGARAQDRFYVGGLDRVRGYRYAEIRSTTCLTANAELRVVAFDSTWFAAMPVAFVDAGLAQRDAAEVLPLLSAGLGLRLMVPRLPRFGIRFEVALPFVGTPAASTEGTRAFAPSFNFGIWHFFS